MSCYRRSQAPVRNVIELLCQILEENGICSVKAETFRKAKFNDGEVTPLLLTVVYKMLCYLENRHQLLEIGRDDMLDFTKKKLSEKHYLSNEMRDLPKDLSCGSRELLLAFGWIFCSEQVICKLIHERIDIFDDSDESLLSVFDINMEMVNKNQSEMNKPDFIKETTSDPFIKIQQLLILNNKLRLNLCNLYSLQREFNTLKQKMYKATSDESLNLGAFTRNHLNVLELKLLKSPEKLKKYLVLLEKDNKSLENFLKWKDCQEVFWKWMESVLDLKLSQSSQGNDLSTYPSETISQLKFDASSKLSGAYKDVEIILDDYDGMLGQIEEICFKKSENVSQKELDSMVSMIEEEIKKYKIILTQSKKHYKPLFKMEKKSKHRKHQVENCGDGDFFNMVEKRNITESLRGVDIQKETKRLNNEISHLEAYLVKQQNKMRAELDQLNSGMKEYYFIPPLRRSQLK